MADFISTYPSTAFDNAMSIQDNLTSTDTNKPLSANQGRVLNDKIGNMIEIGTWSPTIGGETTKGTMTYTLRNANYVKIGKLVHCEFMITGLNLTSSSGVLAIQDLPFVPLSQGCVSGVVAWQTITATNVNFSNIGANKEKLRLCTNGQTTLTNTSLNNVIVSAAFDYVCE